jgi:hypothetical protein
MGTGFTSHDHQYSFDLDLFGPDSLFQSINRCATWPGMGSLAGMLLQTAGEENIITRRQKAFSELSDHPVFCQHFLASGKMHEDDPGDRAKLLEYVNSASYFTSRHGLYLASRFLPFITIGSLVAAILGVVPFSFFILFFLVQLGITIFFLGRINLVHQKVTRQLGSLRKYGELLHIIQQTSFNSPLLKSLQRYLRTNGLAPSDYIVKLAGIVDAFDNRLNIIAGICLTDCFSGISTACFGLRNGTGGTGSICPCGLRAYHEWTRTLVFRFTLSIIPDSYFHACLRMDPLSMQSPLAIH